MSANHTKITAEDLRAECLKVRYSRQLPRPEVFPSDENWQYIISRSMTGIGAGLYRKYLVSWLMDESDRCDYHNAALQRFPEYMLAVPREYALNVVYGDIDSCAQATKHVIIESKLFDARRLMELLGDEDTPRIGFVVECLCAYQPEYTAGDLAAMKMLLAALRDPDPFGEITQSRGMFGQTTKYICPHGHVNDVSEEYCHVEDCGLNIYGLTREQDAMIDEYETRVKALAKLLGQ